MTKGLFHNWELKILALISAIVLWFFVVGIENNSYSFPEQIPIQAINIPPDMAVTNDLGKATIRIRGNQDMIKTLTAADFDVSVNLTSSQAGEQNLPISAASNNASITILKVDPATVHVVLEPVAQKNIPVKPVISGNPAKGYSFQTAEAEPKIVTVSGGKNLLDTLNSIPANIKLDGTEIANFKENVTLQLPDAIAALKNVTLNPQQVTLAVTISQDLQQKTVVIKPDLQGSTDLATMSKQLLVTPSNIVIQGKQGLLNSINSITTEPITLDALKNSTIPLKVKLILPQNITIPDSQPATVLISLTAP